MDEILKRIIILYSTGNKQELTKFLESFSKDDLTSLEKLGYNGYRLYSSTGKKEYCEVKPQNTDNPKKKLNGSGSFNDYTKERFLKDLKENPTILISGFVYGKLIYIIEIKFKCLKEKLKSQLEKHFPHKRKPGEYLRSASFSLKDYIDCSFLKLVYLRKDWRRFKDYLAKILIYFLERNEK